MITTTSLNKFTNWRNDKLSMLGFISVNNSLSLLLRDQGWSKCIFGRRIIIYRLPQNSVHICIL